jgi:plasmid stabilization system protein ParE
MIQIALPLLQMHEIGRAHGDIHQDRVLRLRSSKHVVFALSPPEPLTWKQPSDDVFDLARVWLFILCGTDKASVEKLTEYN